MNADKKGKGGFVLDNELEELWREGLDAEQFERVRGLIMTQGEVEIPKSLESKLKKIALSAELNDISVYRFWQVPSLRYVTATILFVVMVLGGYYLEFNSLPFVASPSTQIATKADQFLQGIIEDGRVTDIFDRDVSILEHLS